MKTTPNPQPALHVAGIHHITGFAKDPQENVDFYRDVLGLRLVKISVNQDDPGTYHLYYGDKVGTPGTAITFFPWSNVAQRRAGNREVGAVAYSVPVGSLGYWQTRLIDHGITELTESVRFGEKVLAFEASIGGAIELIETDQPLLTQPWEGSPVPTKRQIQGFHSATIFHRDPTATIKVLTEILGYRQVKSEGHRQRLVVGEGQAHEILDVVTDPIAPDHRPGAGTIHHLAFRAPTREVHRGLREQVAASGLQITPVIDRFYFDAVYFREPEGVLFEIASDPPGFTTDETVEDLGSRLMLPPFLEDQRAAIEAKLPPIS